MPSISGKVFWDKNSNGSFDGTDAPIADIYVTVRNYLDVCDSVKTNALGDYIFENLPGSQTYNIYETNLNLKGTYTDAQLQTMVCPQVGDNFTSTTVRRRTVTLGTINLTGISFGHNTYAPFPISNIGYICASPNRSEERRVGKEC